MAENKKMLLCPLVKNEDNSVTTVRINDDGKVYVGSVTPTKDGQPIPPGTQLLHTTPLEGSAPWVEGEVVYNPENASEGHSGPAMVNSSAYKAGWDTIFGKKDLN